MAAAAEARGHADEELISILPNLNLSDYYLLTSDY